MTEQKTPTEMLLDATTPIFTKEVGERMALARMKLLWDQKELGEKLGISQQQVGKIESGHRIAERALSTAKFKEVFGDAFMFILFGTGDHRFPENHIRKTYWNHRNSKKGNRLAPRDNYHPERYRGKNDQTQ